MLSKQKLIVSIHAALAKVVGVLADPSKCTHSWRMYIDTLANVAIKTKTLNEATSLIERIVFQRVSLNSDEVAKIVWSIRNASLPKPDVPNNVTDSVSGSAVVEELVEPFVSNRKRKRIPKPKADGKE
jgi:hypothetical protein